MSVILPHAAMSDQPPAGLHPSVFGSPAGLFGLPGPGPAHRFPPSLGPEAAPSPYSTYAAQAYMSSLAAGDTAFYSSLGAAENAADAWRSLSQSAAAAAAAAWSYDPTSLGGGYPYPSPYGGLDVRRKNATRESTATLKAWLFEHIKNPYPTKGEKIMLAIITKMTLTQVSTWFANARRRLKKENKMQWSPRNRTGDDDDDDDDDRASNCSDPEESRSCQGEGGRKSPLLGLGGGSERPPVDWHASTDSADSKERRRLPPMHDEDVDVDGGIEDGDDDVSERRQNKDDAAITGSSSRGRIDNIVSSTSEENARIDDAKHSPDNTRPTATTQQAEKPRIWSLADVATSPASTSSSFQHRRPSPLVSLAGQSQSMTSSSLNSGRDDVMPTLTIAAASQASLSPSTALWMKANAYRSPYQPAAVGVVGTTPSPFDYSSVAAAARYYQQLRASKQLVGVGPNSPFVLPPTVAAVSSGAMALGNRNISPLPSPLSPPRNSPGAPKFSAPLTTDNVRASERMWRS